MHNFTVAIVRGYRVAQSGCIYQKYKRKFYACSLRVVTGRGFGYLCYRTRFWLLVLQDEVLATCVTAVMSAVSVCACLIQHRYFSPSQSKLVS
jgi:hypothetical protein